VTTDATQAERKAVLQNDLRVRRQADAFSYHDRAVADAEVELGGRFGALAKPTVVSGPVYPQQPANSPWHSDPVPDEPSLGYSVEAVEPVGEPGEIARSVAEVEPHEVFASSAPGKPGSILPGLPGSSIRRRI